MIILNVILKNGVKNMEDKTKGLTIIDRFEGEWAVVEFEGRRTLDFPRSMLPATAAEGDVLRFDVKIDKEETEKRRQKAEALAKELFVEE